MKSEIFTLTPGFLQELPHYADLHEGILRTIDKNKAITKFCGPPQCDIRKATEPDRQRVPGTRCQCGTVDGIEFSRKFNEWFRPEAAQQPDLLRKPGTTPVKILP